VKSLNVNTNLLQQYLFPGFFNLYREILILKTMSTSVKSTAPKRNESSDVETSVSDGESEKQLVSSNEDIENQDEDTDGKKIII
jgi:hypothetical protein